MDAEGPHAIEFRRPDLHFDPDTNPDVEDLKLGTTPRLAGEMGTQRAVVHLEQARRGAERAYREERSYPVLGAERLTAQHPWAEPASPRKRRRGVIPSFRVVDDTALEVHCAKETRGFRGRHREALEKLRAGDRDVVFPAGSYLVSACYGLDVEEPDGDCVLAADDTFEDMPERVSDEELRAISASLRSLSTAVETEDSLAERVRAGGRRTRRGSARRGRSRSRSARSSRPRSWCRCAGGASELASKTRPRTRPSTPMIRTGPRTNPATSRLCAAR
ncbi:MAG: hypothetical protein SangKO_077630 [Sandaracinaceae bacterium]